MRSISELTDSEIENIQLFGQIGNKTREIAELQHFYNAIEEEIKRRNLRNDK